MIDRFMCLIGIHSWHYMFSRFMCLIGIHSWHYLLSDVRYVPLHGWPNGTTCSCCGKPHPNPLPDPKEQP